MARLTNAEIAAKLTISKRTVESHVSALRRKLGAHDRLGLVEIGARLTAQPLAEARDRPGSVAARRPGSPVAVFHRPAVGISGGRAEATEARHRLSQLEAATRSARARAMRLQSRSTGLMLASLRQVERTRRTIERARSAIDASPYRPSP